MIGGTIETVKKAVAVNPSNAWTTSPGGEARRAVTTVTVAAQVRASALKESIEVGGELRMTVPDSRPARPHASHRDGTAGAFRRSPGRGGHARVPVPWHCRGTRSPAAGGLKAGALDLRAPAFISLGSGAC